MFIKSSQSNVFQDKIKRFAIKERGEADIRFPFGLELYALFAHLLVLLVAFFEEEFTAIFELFCSIREDPVQAAVAVFGFDEICHAHAWFFAIQG
jgi:hypothetical protein